MSDKNLAPYVRIRELDANGDPLAGGKLYTYRSGTSTPKQTYSDGDGTANANPVVLDSEGSADVWIDDDEPYRFRLETSSGALRWQRDGITNASGAVLRGVTNIAALKLIGGSSTVATIADVSGYYASADGGGGRFWWDSASTATDDGGLVIKATAITTGRWKRLFDGDVNVRWFGAKGDNSTDDSAAFENAIATGYSVFVPEGTYITTGALFMTSGGQMMYGSGCGTGGTIIKASAGWTVTTTDSSLLVMGNRASTTVVSAQCLRNIRLDCNGVSTLSGLEVYGLRDGSTFENVYVTGNSNAPGIITGMAGAGTGSASGKMCEGVQFLNCHVQTNGNMASTEFWRLDGIFESQLIGCKAFGSSAATITDTNGFILGKSAQTRGVMLLGCSAANLTTSGNVGIRYAEWSRECWDQFTLLEQIKGTGVYFHGSTADGGTLCPGNCRSINARPYNNNTAGILDPLYEFGDANGCYAGPVINYNSAKKWVQINSPVVSQFYNSFEVYGNIDFPTFISTNATIGGSAAASNRILGMMGAGSALSQISWGVGGESTNQEANGFIEAHDANFTTWNAPTIDKFRWRSNALATWMALDATGLGLSVPLKTGAAWNGSAPLVMGAYYLWVDSSGRLRIKSGAPGSDTDGTIVGMQS